MFPDVQAALSRPPWVPKYRTTPDNADYSANDCVVSNMRHQDHQRCDDFYNTCHNVYGLSASQVATNIRYWADRARATAPHLLASVLPAIPAVTFWAVEATR